MLNISKNSVVKLLKTDGLISPEAVKPKARRKRTTYIFGGFLLIGFLFLFLPWTQNVPGEGNVTTLKPDQRPQELHSAIAGRIEKWYVREGEYVEKGDTLLFISEIKEDYFDPSLLPRTESQIQVKSSSVLSYKEKVIALEKRITALIQSKALKREQASNKIKQAQLKILSDSISVEASITNNQIAESQFKRIEQLYDEGLKSLTDFEGKRLKLQQTQAKLVSAENKLLTSRNELLNSQVELSFIENDYDEKIAKARSEKFETLSAQYDAEASVTKLQSSYSNYSVRRDLYFIKAPQSGYVTQTLKTGLGETIQQGEEILTIMPSEYDLAVELFVRPLDLPLLKEGSIVRLVFDGWPALVFSGWPGASSGTFGGNVLAIDKFSSPNGKFRVMVVPDQEEIKWPAALRVGSGVKGMALLTNVPIWYEIWRQLNGFPPDFYTDQMAAKAKEKAKSGSAKKGGKK